MSRIIDSKSTFLQPSHSILSLVEYLVGNIKITLQGPSPNILWQWHFRYFVATLIWNEKGFFLGDSTVSEMELITSDKKFFKIVFSNLFWLWFGIVFIKNFLSTEEHWSYLGPLVISVEVNQEKKFIAKFQWQVETLFKIPP